MEERGGVYKKGVKGFLGELMKASKTVSSLT